MLPHPFAMKFFVPVSLAAVLAVLFLANATFTVPSPAFVSGSAQLKRLESQSRLIESARLNLLEVETAVTEEARLNMLQLIEDSHEDLVPISAEFVLETAPVSSSVQCTADWVSVGQSFLIRAGCRC